jgi:hypothetical protein
MSTEEATSQEKKENPRCFFDVTIGDKPGNVELLCFRDFNT